MPSYRKPNVQAPHLCDVTTASELHVLNGATAEFAIPCSYIVEDGTLEPIHLVAEGYGDPVVAYVDQPSGLVCDAWVDPLDDSLIRLVVSAQCPDATEESLICRFSVLISRTVVGRGPITDIVLQGNISIESAPLPAPGALTHYGSGNDVRRYGAVGDGVTDDTAAIQACMNANGIAYFPAGTYLTGKLLLKSNQTLRGDGEALSILKLKPQTNDHLIAGSSVSGVLVEGLTLDHDGDNQTAGNAVRLSSCVNIEFSSCRIKNAYGHNVYILGTSSDVHIHDGKIHDAKTAGASNGVTAEDTVGSVRLVDNLMYRNAQNAIYVGGNNHQIIGNHCYTSGQTNIKVWKGDKHIIANNNSHEAVLGSGIHVDYGVDNAVVTGNTCWGNGEHGIAVMDTNTACSSVNVTGNTVRSNTLTGIYCRGLINGTVSGNTYWNNGTPVSLVNCIGTSAPDMSSVLTFGAKGDGTTDDTAAIQAAITANSGGTVHFQKGIFKVTSTLNVPDNTTIIGVGSHPSASTVINYTGTGYCFSTSGPTHMKTNFADLRILVGATAAGGIAIGNNYESATGGSYMKNVYISGITAGQIGLYTRNVSHLGLDTCVIGSGTGGTGCLMVSSAVNTGVVSAVNTIFGDCTGEAGNNIGLAIYGNELLDSFSFHGCYFGGLSSCVELAMSGTSAVESVHFSGCHFENVGTGRFFALGNVRNLGLYQTNFYSDGSATAGFVAQAGATINGFDVRGLVVRGMSASGYVFDNGNAATWTGASVITPTLLTTSPTMARGAITPAVALY